ncbi:MAG: hypothetical protein P8Y80_15315 [Acidobacteriota bacterium]
MGSPNEPPSIRFGYSIDSVLGSKCLDHVRGNRDLFRVVFDGWKGDGNFLEPNRYWDSLAQHLYPHSAEANEISFDLDFKDMIRTFFIDPEAAGKTCEEYCKDDLKDGRLDVYLEVYTQDEIDNWPTECATNRNRFERERNALLQKYDSAPFTKVLRDIDSTTVVVLHSVC